MSGLKIHPIKLEKEAWEGVAPIVKESLQIVHSNFSSLKQWAIRTDSVIDEIKNHGQQTDSSVDELKASLKASQEQLHGVSDEVNTMQEQSEREFGVFASSIKQLFDGSLMYYDRFLESFEPGADLQDEQLHVESEECTDNIRIPVLEELAVFSKKLDGRLGHVDTAFHNWSKLREDTQEKSRVMRDKVCELQKASELTWERLLSWRELLRESQHEVGSLNVALKRTQDDVRGIQALQVTSEDVHRIVGQRAKGLEELHARTEGRVDSVQNSLELHVGQVNHKIGEMDKYFQTQIDDNTSNFKQMLERSLNPITAYLNSMHIKADEVRVDLDQVRGQVPVLQTSIDDVSSQLRVCDVNARERSTNLSSRVDELARASMDSFERSDSQRAELSDTLHSLCRELGARVSELRTLLEDTSQALDSMKYGELSSLGKNLISLEHKVAKWVHSSQLPAKVSEARLYALEAKLADEAECRLQLEEVVKERGPSRGPLPALTPSRPNTQGRPPSRPNTQGRTRDMQSSLHCSSASDHAVRSGSDHAVNLTV